MNALKIILAVGVLLVGLILGLTYINCRHVEKMAELGFQETILPGSSMPHWRKIGG